MIDDKDVKSSISCSPEDISQLQRDFRELSHLSEKNDLDSKEALKELLTKMSSNTGISRTKLLNSYSLEVTCNGSTEVIGRENTKASIEIEPAEANHLPSGEPVKEVYDEFSYSQKSTRSQSSRIEPIDPLRLNRKEPMMSFIESSDILSHSADSKGILHRLEVDKLSKEMAYEQVAGELGLTQDQLSEMIKENPNLYKKEITKYSKELRPAADMLVSMSKPNLAAYKEK